MNISIGQAVASKVTDIVVLMGPGNYNSDTCNNLPKNNFVISSLEITGIEGFTSIDCQEERFYASGTGLNMGRIVRTTISNLVIKQTTKR